MVSVAYFGQLRHNKTVIKHLQQDANSSKGSHCCFTGYSDYGGGWGGYGDQSGELIYSPVAQISTPIVETDFLLTFGNYENWAGLTQLKVVT